MLMSMSFITFIEVKGQMGSYFEQKQKNLAFVEALITEESNYPLSYMTWAEAHC